MSAANGWAEYPWRTACSRLRNWKKLSAMTLSRKLPRQRMLGRNGCALRMPFQPVAALLVVLIGTHRLLACLAGRSVMAHLSSSPEGYLCKVAVPQREVMHPDASGL